MSPGLPTAPPPPPPGIATDKCITILGWTHLQHTSIAVAFAPWSFLLFLGLQKIPAGKRDSYTRMLQMNPP